MARTKAAKMVTFVPTDIESRIRKMLHKCGRENPQADGYVAEIIIKRKKSPVGPSIE